MRRWTVNFATEGLAGNAQSVGSKMAETLSLSDCESGNEPYISKV